MSQIVRAVLLPILSMHAAIGFAANEHIKESAAKYVRKFGNGRIECQTQVAAFGRNADGAHKYFPHQFIIKTMLHRTTNQVEYQVLGISTDKTVGMQGVKLSETIYQNRTESGKPASVQITGENLEVIMVPREFYDSTRLVSPISRQDSVLAYISVNLMPSTTGKLSGRYSVYNAQKKEVASFNLECMFLKF